MTEKLQKILSRAGIASRRALEQMIDQGRVTVNGKMATIGDRYEADDILVKIDGKVVLTPDSQKVSCRVLMYHKPEGELTTLSDPENRPTVFDHIPKPPTGRWIYIGRLDINTSGLLLFTTDGELANALMHPKYEVERVYAARIYGEVSEEQIDQLTQGVMLEDGKARFNKVTYVGGEGRNAWYHVTLKEGRKREVRRLWEAVGLKVSRLIRIKYAGIDLDPDLKTGQFRELTLNELNRLRKAVHLEPVEELAPALDLNVSSSNKGRKATKAPVRKPVSFNSSKEDNDDKSSRRSPYGKPQARSARGDKSAFPKKGKTFGESKGKRFSKDSSFDKNDRRKTFTKDDSSKKFVPKSNNSAKHFLSHTNLRSEKDGQSFNKGYAVKSRGSAVSKSSFARPRRTNRGSY